MKMKLSLAIAAATVSLAALAGGALFLSDRAVAQEEGTALSEGDKAFLKIVPEAPGPETAGLVPHASPEEAAAIATVFFETPWPSDAELAAIAPFVGTENVPVQQCREFLPNAYTEEIILAPGSPERRMKGEIYAMISAQRVLLRGDCSCAGKTAPWEPVPIIFKKVVEENGSPTGLLFDRYRNETRRLRRVVERVCNGAF